MIDDFDSGETIKDTQIHINYPYQLQYNHKKCMK